MKNILTTLIALCSIAFISTANAQYIYNREGNQLKAENYTDVEGSAYLTDGWSAGTVKTVNNKVFKDEIKLMYNVFADQLFFTYTGKDTLTFVDPVKEFTIIYSENNKPVTKMFRNGYLGGSKNNTDAFFEVIADGKVQVVKKNIRTITDVKSYGSANVLESFRNSNSYYIVKDNKLIAINNDKKSIVGAIGDKQQQLLDYIIAGNLNLKLDADLAKLLVYYNSL